MKIVDGTNMVLGRLATLVAKSALKGEKVTVVNCEDIVIVGKKKEIFARYKQKSMRGTSSTGPYIHRAPDKIVRRTIRGMIPYKTPEGSAAFKRVMCYVGVPAEIDASKAETAGVNINDTQNLNYVTVGDVSKLLGAKL